MHTPLTTFFGIFCRQPHSRLNRRALAGLVLAVVMPQVTTASAAGITAVPRVPPGTVIPDESAPRFNRVVYLAVSHITSGDAEKVPSVIRARVPMFTLTLLATASNTSPAGAPPSYRLAEVGVGYAVPINGRLTVVDTESPPSAAGIDMLGRQVLSANGRNLGSLRSVGKTDTLQVIDIDALVRVGNQHATLTMRHFVWADPATGRVASCVWLLQKRPDGRLAPMANPPRWLQENTRDTRRIHVDASKFVLGVPTKEAFALASLPPGIELAWTPRLQQLASLLRYGDAELEQLTAAVNEALEPLRAPAG